MTDPKKRALQNKPQIISMYRKGVPMTKIGDRTGLNYKTLAVYLRDWGVKKPGKSKLDPHKEYIIKHYHDRSKSVEEMARKLKVSPSTISNALRKWGVPRNRGFYRKKTRIIKTNKQDIIDAYKSGLTHKEVGDKFGLAESTVALRLKEWGVPARSYKKAPKKTVHELYKQGNSPEEIAEELDTDTSTIYDVLTKKLGIHHTKKVQFSETDDKTIKQLANEGYSVPLLTKKFNQRQARNVSTTVMRRRMKELKVETSGKIQKPRSRGSKAYKQEKKDRFVEHIKKRRAESATYKEMAQELGISTSLVARIIKEHDIPKKKKVFTKKVQEEVGRLYEQGNHYTDIASELGLKAESVRQELTRMGYSRKNSPWSKSYDPIIQERQKELIKEWYEKPYLASMTAIAKKLDLDKTTVKGRLQKMGIPVKSRKELKKARDSMLKKRKPLQLSRLQKKELGMYDKPAILSEKKQRTNRIRRFTTKLEEPTGIGDVHEEYVKETGDDISLKVFGRYITRLRQKRQVTAKIGTWGQGRSTIIYPQTRK